MSQLTTLYIAATGMMTPVGFNTQMTLAALSAGISAYQESPFYNRNYLKMKTAPIPDDSIEIPDIESDKVLANQSRYKRMLGIATVAISEVFEHYDDELALPLFLGGPESLLSQETAIDSDFIKHLADISGTAIDVNRSRLFATGQTSVLEAIDLAFTYMEQTGAPHVLVGGVDSFIDPYVLSGLEMQERVLTADNSDGFAPGEGAAFLLLSSNKTVLNNTDNKMAIIQRPGFADEVGHRHSTEPYRGDGLAAAVKQTLLGSNSGKIKTLFTSMNGESFAAKELGVTMLRNSKQLDDNMAVEHPADALGDTGAAIGAILIALAAAKTSQRSIICCSAEQAKRAACTVETN